MPVFTKKTWVDRQAQYPNRRKLTDVSTGTEQVVEVSRQEGTVSVAGHPFNANNMNDLENRIDGAVTTLQSNFQDGVDSVYNACVDKGSTPTSHSLTDVVEAIENISSVDYGVNMFGTPESDTPDNGEISTGKTPYTDHDAYRAFGNNTGWVCNDTDYPASDSVVYNFTDGSKYRPTQIKLCGNFITQEEYYVADALVKFQASNDGTTWVDLCSTENPPLNTLVTMTTDVNEYYSQFRFVCTAKTVYKAGLKAVVCHGFKKEASGGGNTLLYMVQPIIGKFESVTETE